MATTQDVYDALAHVNDPELGIGIVPLGLVYNVDVNGPANDNAVVTMTFTSPMCPVAPGIKQNVQDAVAGVPGVNSVEIEVTFTPPWDPRVMANDDVKLMLGLW